MRTSAIFFRYSLATTLLLAGAGCDRLQPSPPKPKEAQWVSESISLSLDSLLDTAVANEAREVDEAHKKGHPNTVGSRDGKWWLESNALMRIAYVNAIGDLVSTLSGINVATSGAMESQKRLKTLDYNFESGTFGGPVDAESQFSSRIQEVIAGGLSVT